MKIKIKRNLKLINGDIYFDSEEEIETNKPLSLSIIGKHDEEGKKKKIIYLQIGNFLQKDFKEYEINEWDVIHIKQ